MLSISDVGVKNVLCVYVITTGCKFIGWKDLQNVQHKKRMTTIKLQQVSCLVITLRCNRENVLLRKIVHVINTLHFPCMSGHKIKNVIIAQVFICFHNVENYLHRADF